MNILFINPSWHQRSENMWKYIRSCTPPFGIALLASLLEREGHKVAIFDSVAELVGNDELAGRLPEGPWDIIGITATTNIFPGAIKALAAARARFPQAVYAMGGVHPSVMPEEALAGGADIVVRGEGEGAMLELAAGTAPAEVAGLSWKRGGEFVHNPDRPPLPSISDLPMPAYHLLPMERYRSALGSYRREPSVGMVVSRGCPGRCTYCFGNFLGNRIRFRTAAQILDEMSHLMAEFGFREVSFYDDTFTTYPELVREVCQGIIDRRIDVTWSCFSRVDRVDEETLRLMKRAGCHQIMFGIESADQVILSNIRKRIDLETAAAAIAMTEEAGIEVRAAFMFGNPGETAETMQRTLDFAIKANPDFAVFNVTTPFPGSAMFDWADENGYLTTKDWAKYDLATVVLELPTVPSATVLAFYRQAYRAFYLRPRYVLRRILKMRNLDDLKVNWRALKAMLSY